MQAKCESTIILSISFVLVVVVNPILCDAAASHLNSFSGKITTLLKKKKGLSA